MHDIRSYVEAEESSSFDCKKSFYKLPEKRFELVKDIVAMANATKRFQKDSCILIGKKDNQFYNVEYEGVPDEASIQQMVNSVVEPPIKFSIKQKGHNGYSLLLIVIPHSSRKPHFLTKYKDSRGKDILAGQCFVRRGSSTSLANRIEVAEMVYDADSKMSPFMKLARYVEAQQKAEEPVSAKDFEKLLYRDLMPLLHMPFNNRYYTATNSDGVIVSRKIIGGDIPEKQEVMLSSVNQAIDEERYDLAERLFTDIPEKDESIHCCTIGGVLFAKLNKIKESDAFFERAFALDPNYIYLNYRYAESLCEQNEIAKSIAYYEKTLELCYNNESQDIYRASLSNLGIVYYQNKIFGRAKSLLREFLDTFESIEGKQSIFIKNVLNEMQEAEGIRKK